MTFTELADTKYNAEAAIRDIEMIKYFAQSSASEDATIKKILDYCDFAWAHLKDARECLQTEIDNILKEEGYK